MTDNECIEWKGAKNPAGYGITWWNNHWAYAHRAAANAQTGEVIRHLCDNPSCVNPAHLSKGTHKDNSQDMVNKSRQAWGELAGNSKLTKEEVKQIRNLKGITSSRVTAKMFNVSKTNILEIWSGKIWSKLDE